MSAKKILTLKSRFEEIKKLNRFLKEFFKYHSLDTRNKLAIQLSLEEIFNNIVMYGYQGEKQHEIIFHFENKNNVVTISIEDDGISFNPLTRAGPEITTPLQDRQVGGLGIHLVRSQMDHLSYQRKNNKNILTIKKNVK